MIDQQQVGNLFFLDKSARPLVTVFQDFWKKTHPNMPLPEIGFMQIGSETKERVVDEDNDDKESEFSEDSPFYYARDETQKIIANYGYEIHNLRSRYSHLQSSTPSQKAMIIDDIAIDGGTMEAARYILKAAFPEFSDRNQILGFVFSSHLDPSDRGKLFSVNGGGWRAPWADVTGATGVVDAEHQLMAQSAHQVGYPQKQVHELREEMHEIAREYDSDWQQMYDEIKAKYQEAPPGQVIF